MLYLLLPLHDISPLCPQHLEFIAEIIRIYLYQLICNYSEATNGVIAAKTYHCVAGYYLPGYTLKLEVLIPYVCTIC